MHLTVASLTCPGDPFFENAARIWQEFADEIAVLIDRPDAETENLCQDLGVFYDVWRGPPMQGNEWRVRKRLWRTAMSREPEWLLHLDADQVPSCDPRPYLRQPVSVFRVFDLWGPDEFRADAWWTGHRRCWWPAVHIPSLPHDFKDEWPERGWHSGHVPDNLPGPYHEVPVDCAILHYAYSAPDLREQKARMYEDLGPHLTAREKFHAKTIVAPDPNTHPLPFEPEWRLHR